MPSIALFKKKKKIDRHHTVHASTLFVVFIVINSKKYFAPNDAPHTYTLRYVLYHLVYSFRRVVSSQTEHSYVISLAVIIICFKSMANDIKHT